MDPTAATPSPSPARATPDGIGRWVAPGRVNLVGEHLDYNGGPSLPIAIDRQTSVKARLSDSGTVAAWSAGAGAPSRFPVGVVPGEVEGWGAYVAGVVWALREAGHAVPGLELVIDSDVPVGAGLSSSAALECAVAVAVLDLLGAEVDPVAVALLAQRAENDAVGVPSGAMDQLASMCGTEGHAVLVETASTPPTATPVPALWTADGLALVVVDTRASHSLADGEYAARREECERAAGLLGLEHLADAPLDAVLRLDDPVLTARVRHVLTETARTRSAVRCLRERSWSYLGTILTASHASLRDDYQVSCAELDLAVDTALEHGALGARMTGGGFGGSAIALVPDDRVRPLVAAVETAFLEHELTAPRSFVVAPSAGARRVG